MLLNRANAVLGIIDISSRGMSGTVADPEIIFAAAIKCAASTITLLHNHPSGNLKTSSADITLTRRSVQGGEILDIKIVDHLIISSEDIILLLMRESCKKVRRICAEKKIKRCFITLLQR